MVSDDDPSTRTGFDSRFDEVLKNELLASSGAWDGIPGQAEVWPSNLRVEFHDQHGKTRLVVREGPHPPATADLGRQAWEMMLPNWSPCSAADIPTHHLALTCQRWRVALSTKARSRGPLVAQTSVQRLARPCGAGRLSAKKCLQMTPFRGVVGVRRCARLGLSRRRSRVRVPSLPPLHVPANGHFCCLVGREISSHGPNVVRANTHVEHRKLPANKTFFGWRSRFVWATSPRPNSRFLPPKHRVEAAGESARARAESAFKSSRCSPVPTRTHAKRSVMTLGDSAISLGSVGCRGHHHADGRVSI